MIRNKEKLIIKQKRNQTMSKKIVVEHTNNTLEQEYGVEIKSSTSNPKITDKDLQVLKTLTTESSRVRYLTPILTRAEIVKIYPELFGRDIIYQHVRNIQVQKITKK